MSDVITEGNIASVTGVFKDENGDLIDPGTVQFEYAITPSSSAQGSTTTLTYTGNSVPGPGLVARLSLGTFQAQANTTALTGVWTFEWVATGTAQCVSDPPGVFVVQPRAL